MVRQWSTAMRRIQRQCQSWAALRQRLIPHEVAKLFVLLWILAYAWITSWSHFKQQAGWKLQSPSLQGIEHLEIARRLLGRFLHVYRFISQPGLSGLEVSKAPGRDNKVRQSVYDCVCFYRANFTWIACSHIHNWVKQAEASCRKLGVCLFLATKQTNWCWRFNRELGSNKTMCVCVCVFATYFALTVSLFVTSKAAFATCTAQIEILGL